MEAQLDHGLLSRVLLALDYTVHAASLVVAAAAVEDEGTEAGAGGLLLEPCPSSAVLLETALWASAAALRQALRS